MTTPPVAVELLGRRSASAIFYDVLSAVLEKFKLADESLRWPSSAKQFKRQYVSLLPEVEALRLSSQHRLEIARELSIQVQKHLVWGDSQVSIHDFLAEQADPLPLAKVVGGGSSRWAPKFQYEDKTWQDFAALGSQLISDNVITASAGKALAWVASNVLDNEEVRLKRKIVVLGAAAEMASTREFLSAGADVLWLDRAPPPSDLVNGQGFSGTLCYPPNNADLLTQPREILSTILAFAGSEAVDICLYAYAPGRARELKLAGTMNAIVNRLPRDLIASVTMLISPTTPVELQTSDKQSLQLRHERRPAWEAMLDRTRLLGSTSGMADRGGCCAVRSIVSIQGTGYQAAQYLCKVMMAETWASQGQIYSDAASPLRVSANTAAITRTKSLEHPVFDAAFGGAAALQVQTLTPEQSRCLNALLTIHDWLHEELPRPGKLRVHGGIHTLPYPLESALRPAAAIGFIKSPRLLLGLLKKR